MIVTLRVLIISEQRPTVYTACCKSTHYVTTAHIVFTRVAVLINFRITHRLAQGKSVYNFFWLGQYHFTTHLHQIRKSPKLHKSKTYALLDTVVFIFTLWFLVVNYTNVLLV